MLTIQFMNYHCSYIGSYFDFSQLPDLRHNFDIHSHKGYSSDEEKVCIIK